MLENLQVLSVIVGFIGSLDSFGGFSWVNTLEDANSPEIL
jgi:hypothetical protein